MLRCVAHGHHVLVKDALRELSKRIPSRIHLMAGNVATKEAFMTWPTGVQIA